MMHAIKQKCARAVLLRVLSILILGTSMSGCADTLTWQEEVKLADGRVIVVTQKRRYESAYSGHGSGASSIPREAWLTFKLPEFGDKEIVWHENLDTQVLNVHKGKLYIVGFPHTEREFRQYGSPRPSYIGFRYDQGQWVRIPFNEIPIAIYGSNMWFDSAPENKSKHVSLTDKARQINDGMYPKELKRIDPRYVMINF